MMQLADDSQFSNDRISRQQTTSVDCNVNDEMWYRNTEG